MSVHRQPENTNKSHEAHPSLGKAPYLKGDGTGWAVLATITLGIGTIIALAYFTNIYG